MPNPFSHVDQRVPDLDAGIAFYRALLPAVGFTEYEGGRAFRTWTTADGTGPERAWFGITEDRDHRPNANRIAFWVGSRADVDRVARLLESAGARAVSGPKLMPEYQESYYAVFFDDPFGNALEVLHWEERALERRFTLGP